MIQLLAKLLKTLNSDASPNQISVAFVFAMLMAFAPLWSLVNLFYLLCICLFRINLSSFLVAFALFSAVAYLLDGVFIVCGEALLRQENLLALWTSLYQSDVWRLLHFNNTLMLGSQVIGFALALPLFMLCRLLIARYRSQVLTMVQKSRLMHWLQATQVFEVYQSMSRVKGRLTQ